MPIDPKISTLNEKLLRDLYGDALVNANQALNGALSSIINKNRLSDTNQGKGKEYMHNLYPDEIEYYACALELVDSSNVSKIFTFPVMPDSIEENKPTNSSIKKTQGGVIINNNPTFKPFEIMINGNFGRRFRKLVAIDGQSPDFRLNQNSSNLLNVTSNVNGYGDIIFTKKSFNPYFDSDYKTGYGNIKILEKIIEDAKGQDDNFLPYKLFFYNFSLNSNYLVEPQSLRIFQNKDKNMIWSYNLNFKAVAPADALLKNGKNDLIKKLQVILNFSRRNIEMGTQAQGIKDLLTDNGAAVTQIEKILKNQIAARSQQGLSNGQKSALQAITQLTANPSDIDDFIVNAGQGILTRL